MKISINTNGYFVKTKSPANSTGDFYVKNDFLDHNFPPGYGKIWHDTFTKLNLLGTGKKVSARID